MQQDLALALRLQALDRKMAALEQEIASLPRLLAESEKKLESHARKLEADRAALTANQRDRKKLDGDIQVHEQKISKLRDQMTLAKTNEQYRAFQNEIAYAGGEIRKCEDRILDLMEQSEALESNVAKADLELKKERAQVEAEKTRSRERTDADQRGLSAAREERKTVAGGMTPGIYADYERIRRKTKGSVVAEAVDGRCDACQIAFRPQFFQDLRKGESIMFCESCGRMLHYNPAVDVSADIAASHRIA